MDINALKEEIYHFIFFTKEQYVGKISPTACSVLMFVIFVTMVALHVCLHILLENCSAKYRAIKPDAKETKPAILLTMLSLAAVVLISPCYFHAAYELRLTEDTRWEQVTYYGQLGLAFHCGCTFYETLIYIFMKKGIEFYVHHVLVLACYIPVLLSGQMGFFAYFDGTVEVTNVFLCSLPILRLYDLKSSFAYVFCGLSLWVSFLIIRLIGMSYWIYLFVNDYLYNQDYFDRNLCIAKWIALPVTIFLLVLSSYWFKPITKGLLKALNTKKKEM